MFKIALLVWIMLGTTLAGIGVMVVVATPSFFDAGMKLIPIAAACGFVVAAPLAVVIAKRILGLTGGR